MNLTQIQLNTPQIPMRFLQTKIRAYPYPNPYLNYTKQQCQRKILETLKNLHTARRTTYP